MFNTINMNSKATSNPGGREYRMDLEDIRREYLRGGLRRDNLSPDPFEQFDQWLQEAVDSQVPDPTAFVLATVSQNGQPEQRIVLLKHADPSGFVFFTNYGSAKAAQIAANDRVSLLFPWHCMERQVRIAGVASKIKTSESLKYFATRPKESQLAAWASKQSARIDSRSALLMQFEAMKNKFARGQVPLPDFWGGYKVKPERFEFWQGGASRLHDRFEYQINAQGNWEISRLAP